MISSLYAYSINHISLDHYFTYFINLIFWILFRYEIWIKPKHSVLLLSLFDDVLVMHIVWYPLPFFVSPVPADPLLLFAPILVVSVQVQQWSLLTFFLSLWREANLWVHVLEVVKFEVPYHLPHVKLYVLALCQIWKDIFECLIFPTQQGLGHTVDDPLDVIESVLKVYLLVCFLADLEFQQFVLGRYGIDIVVHHQQLEIESIFFGQNESLIGV